MQTQGMPNRISDFDLMMELDSCCKNEATQLTRGILESSNPQLRQELKRSLEKCFDDQWQLFQLMQRKGYYRPLPSSSEMLQVARDQMQMAMGQVGGGASATAAPQTISPRM